jgi:hypothetical protein
MTSTTASTTEAERIASLEAEVRALHTDIAFLAGYVRSTAGRQLTLPSQVGCETDTNVEALLYRSDDLRGQSAHLLGKTPTQLAEMEARKVAEAALDAGEPLPEGWSAENGVLLDPQLTRLNASVTEFQALIGEPRSIRRRAWGAFGYASAALLALGVGGGMYVALGALFDAINR